MTLFWGIVDDVGPHTHQIEQTRRNVFGEGYYCGLVQSSHCLGKQWLYRILLDTAFDNATAYGLHNFGFDYGCLYLRKRNRNKLRECYQLDVA